MQPQCPSSPPRSPNRSFQPNSFSQPNPKNKKLYAALAKHLKLPRILSITPKQSVKLRSKKDNEICLWRGQDSPSESSESEKEQELEYQELDPNIIERYEKYLAKLNAQRTPFIQTISPENGSNYKQIMEILQRHNVKVGFIKKTLRQSFTRVTMWQMYYNLYKKDKEQQMNPQSVKFLDQFYAKQRKKLNELFPGELETILIKTISCHKNSRSKLLMDIAKETGRNLTNCSDSQEEYKRKQSD